MAGLSDITSTSSTATTTLPSWYDAAQQNLTAKAVAATPPDPSQTSGQYASDTFAPGNTNNPFTQSQSILSSIGTGAANPWITTTDASGNARTTGNPATAMGGLFNAQTDYLNQIMPNVTATPEAAGIGGGNFGSLRGMTAVNKAKGDAFADMIQKQNTAALQNQTTGVQAGTGLSDSGAKATQAALNTGTYELEAPTKGLTGQANLINNLKPGTTVTTTGTPSILNQVGGLSSLSKSVMDSLFGPGAASSGILDQISNWWNSGGSTNTTDPAVYGTTTEQNAAQGGDPTSTVENYPGS